MARLTYNRTGRGNDRDAKSQQEAASHELTGTVVVDSRSSDHSTQNNDDALLLSAYKSCIKSNDARKTYEPMNMPHLRPQVSMNGPTKGRAEIDPI